MAKDIEMGRSSAFGGSRPGRARGLAALGLAILLALLPANPAALGQLEGTQEAIGAGASTWNFGNTNGVRRPPLSVIPEGEADRSVPGFGLDDATLSGLGPALDTSATLWINNLQFATDTFAESNGVISAGPVVTQGVSVTVQHSLVVDAALLRTLVTFTNSSGSAVNLNQVDWIFSEIGGDENATRASSTGDTVFTVEDRWMVSGDVDDPAAPSVPHVMYGLYGAGSPALTPATVATRVYQVGAPSNNQRGMKVTFGPITIAAGSTRRLLFFTGLYARVANATAAATALGSTTSCAFYGLTANQRLEIANWSLAASPAATQCLRLNLTSVLRQ